MTQHTHVHRLGIIKVIALLLAWLVAGAALNVAVAWGCARWSTLLPYRTLEALESGRCFENRRMVYRVLTINPGQEGRGFGSRSLLVMGQGELPSPDANHATASLMLYAFEAGWPKVSLAAEWRYVGSFSGLPTTGTLHGGWETPLSHLHFRGVPFALPRRPLWPGFAINTLFYAGVLWVLLCGPFALRRMIRRHRGGRGRCPTCAYPIGSSAVCTECGQELQPRGNASRSG